MMSRPGVRPNDGAPVVDRAATSAALITSYLDLLQRLAQASAAEQAEIMAAAQREYELAATPSHQLRYALTLATPGHAATDLPRAQRLLRELMATPETLLPAERELLELQKVDAQLTLAAENRRLQTNVARDDRDRTSALSKLQTEIDENARLRKELEEARAKLGAISDIEKSMSERKPAADGRAP
jgi:hypothetical protein